MAGCAGVAAVVLFIGSHQPFSPMVLGGEVLLTIMSLFVFGSMKYQVDKNALTYGAMMVIGATFFTGWWPASHLRFAIQNNGMSALAPFLHHYLLTLHGLDDLIHADTMLFILGLTFFVAVIAQTKILENISFFILKKTKGHVFPTLAILMAIVSFSSGILDGVSMIGLLIRTMVIILVLAKIDGHATKFAVIVSTVITTVCGMWLAYGEPPNLIMKANLHPYLTNGFFLRYCLPVAVGSYLIVMWNVHKWIKDARVDMHNPEIQSMRTSTPHLRHARRIGLLAFLPFIGFLIWHGVDHSVPLFWSSCVAFVVAFSGIASYPEIRTVALHEAKHEYKEYLFLFPLFLSITLLQKSGFFDQLIALVHSGIETLGVTTMAYLQYSGAVGLSALLDNNVVADFASRALHGLDLNVLHLFAMSQVAGYAVGGCWTHIGSAQSVVAFSFIKKEVDKRFSPFSWIKMMTPLIFQLSVWLLIVILAEHFLF